MGRTKFEVIDGIHVLRSGEYSGLTLEAVLLEYQDIAYLESLAKTEKELTNAINEVLSNHTHIRRCNG